MVADLGRNFAHGPAGLRVVFDGLFRAQERGTGEEVGAEISGFNRGAKMPSGASSLARQAATPAAKLFGHTIADAKKFPAATDESWQPARSLCQYWAARRSLFG